jgi:hypothetical protein
MERLVGSANYAIALVQHGVSVSVLFDSGVMKGRFVKESGQVPVCRDKGYCSTRSGDFTVSQVRKAYVVVQAVGNSGEIDRVEVIGELSAENLEVAVGRVAPFIQLRRASGED